jgi:hypothetical protein
VVEFNVIDLIRIDGRRGRQARGDKKRRLEPHCAMNGALKDKVGDEGVLVRARVERGRAVSPDAAKMDDCHHFHHSANNLSNYNWNDANSLYFLVLTPIGFQLVYCLNDRFRFIELRYRRNWSFVIYFLHTTSSPAGLLN